LTENENKHQTDKIKGNFKKGKEILKHPHIIHILRVDIRNFKQGKVYNKSSLNLFRTSDMPGRSR
jgi:hypothetical protein